MIIARLAGNSAIYRILDDPCEKLVLKRRIEGVSQGGFAVSRQHGEILQAIKRKDVRKAQEIMTVHLEEIKNSLLRQIAARTKIARAR